MATTFAVVIGVAFVAGSYVLTDTIFAAFDEIFSESLKGTSVVVTAKNPVEQENGEVPTISASLLPRVKQHAGRPARLRRDLHPRRLLRLRRRRDRQQIRAQVHLLDAARRARVAHLRRWPPAARPDRSLARRGGGRKRRPRARRKDPLIGQGSARSFRLVGFTRLGSASFGGASIAQVTLPVAQRITHKRGRFDQISVAARAASRRRR